ncbi:hypothetical protein GW937_00825 [Candidatus Kaiserbacteria bacterium]|nr:hypothetical protein [Candidatus Kaiserbacteria bacterium]NCT01653.1 hypothetical protein [Candidatus Parcubacteria bacterium]
MNTFGTILLFVVIITGVWWSITMSEKTVSIDKSASSLQSNIAKDESDPEPGSFKLGGSVEVYPGVSVAKNIQFLDLSGRGLDGSLKAEVRYLTELRELNISNNNFTGLPAEIGQLSQLQKIDLSDNPFTGLPHELGNLKNLAVIDLSGTQYAEQDLMVIRQTLPTSTIVITE